MRRTMPTPNHPMTWRRTESASHTANQTLYAYPAAVAPARQAGCAPSPLMGSHRAGDKIIIITATGTAIGDDPASPRGGRRGPQHHRYRVPLPARGAFSAGPLPPVIVAGRGSANGPFWPAEQPAHADERMTSQPGSPPISQRHCGAELKRAVSRQPNLLPEPMA